MTVERAAQMREFGYACDGLVDAVVTAADADYPEWSAYYGDRIGVAVWKARDIVRRARRLGLYAEDAAVRRAA